MIKNIRGIIKNREQKITVYKALPDIILYMGWHTFDHLKLSLFISKRMCDSNCNCNYDEM